jgi:hypothetical protein
MGASVIGYWPGITEEQIESQPGFFNDCKAWGDWMAEREKHQDVLKAMRELDVAPLLSFKTDGVEDGDVPWVSPDDLSRAALRLRNLVLAGDPKIKRILETYAASANEVDPVEQEFAQDLADIAELAEFALAQGVARMTLEVNW